MSHPQRHEQFPEIRYGSGDGGSNIAQGAATLMLEDLLEDPVYFELGDVTAQGRGSFDLPPPVSAPLH